MNIVLRPLTLKDTPNIVKWRNSKDVKCNLFNHNDISEEQHLQYYRDYILTKKTIQFIIVADGVDCGTTFLKNIDFINKKAEFGIFIGEKAFRGRGIGSIAASKMVEIGFKKLGLNSIYLMVFSTNIAAIKSYIKTGFVISKTDINYLSSNGTFVQTTEMRINKTNVPF